MAILITPKPSSEVEFPTDPTTRSDSINIHGKILCDLSGKIPINIRFDSLFELKRLGGQEAIDWISRAFVDVSPLLKHELAYVLGQMTDVRALPTLYRVLRDPNEHPMVRHEAGEAIGAVGQLSSIPVLEEYLSDENVSVRETCELSIARIKYENSLRKCGFQETKTLRAERNGPYSSVDPAPPEEEENEDMELLSKNLMDASLPLFKRYRAMFSLRNIGGKDAVLSLARGFSEKRSALFRHEIAYVFGQMQNEASVPFLEEVLDDPNEESMVRHECAEALGSIGSNDALNALKKHLNDKCIIVRESCIVGLGIANSI